MTLSDIEARDSVLIHDLGQEIDYLNFYITYHGLNDREIQVKITYTDRCGGQLPTSRCV